VEIQSLLSIHPETLGGHPVFKGTRVPVETFFDHLKQGISIDDFLDDFPTVTKEQAIGILELTGKLFSARNLTQIYEAVV
jgi:uncharacterized protein (DUF433 family)